MCEKCLLILECFEIFWNVTAVWKGDEMEWHVYWDGQNIAIELKFESKRQICDDSYNVATFETAVATVASP